MGLPWTVVNHPFYWKWNPGRKFQASANQTLLQRKSEVDTFSSTQLLIKSAGTSPANGIRSRKEAGVFKGDIVKWQVEREG